MKQVFSIIIPTLNEETNLPILLSCLERQTYKKFEVIHVDGKSEDNTKKVAQNFSNRIDIKTISANKRNVCFQRNLGSKQASGLWLIFMDADDQISDDFLERLEKKIDNCNCDLFVPFYDPDIKKLKYKLLTSFSNFLTVITKNSEFPFATEALFGVKKNVYQELDGFDEKIKVNEGKFFVNKARKKGYKYEVFNRPRYLNSMRRAEKVGLLTLLKNNFIIATKVISGNDLTSNEVGNLYKMEGGSTYRK